MIDALFIEDSRAFGGAVTSLLELLRNIDRSRIRPHLIHSSKHPLFATFDDVCWHRHVPGPGVGLPKSVRPLAKRLNLDAAIAARAIRRAAQQLRPAVYVLNNDVIVNRAGLLAARLSGLPVVCHERGILNNEPRLFAFLKGWVDEYIAVSERGAQAMREYGIDDRSLSLVYEGFDLGRFHRPPDDLLHDLRRELQIPDGALVVLLPGIVIEWKGQHVLLEAIPEVARQVPAVVFLFAGSTAYDRDPYLDGLLHRSATLGLSETAQFLGHRSDILDLMYLADVVVHTSTSPEPFGRVIVEGMLCGKPVVATDIGGPKEIIKSGQTGILLPPGDPAALSTTLVELLQSPDLREALGSRAMSHAQANYGIDRHAEAVTQVIERAHQRTARL